MASNQARLVLYEKIRGNFPAKMKVSPIAAIPHKSKEFISILDLSFSLKLNQNGHVSSVNEYSKNTATGGAIDQLGHVLLCLTHVLSEASDCSNIFQAKWDI